MDVIMGRSIFQHQLGLVVPEKERVQKGRSLRADRKLAQQVFFHRAALFQRVFAFLLNHGAALADLRHGRNVAVIQMIAVQSFAQKINFLHPERQFHVHSSSLCVQAPVPAPASASGARRGACSSNWL